MSNPDTFGPHGVGVVDITPEYGPDYPPRELRREAPEPKIRIYQTFGRYGRRSKQTRYEWEFDYGLSWLKRALALAGMTDFPEARLWGKVIHAIGTEEGILTVHLRERYAWWSI